MSNNARMQSLYARARANLTRGRAAFPGAELLNQTGGRIGVDRDKKLIRGAIAAVRGPLKGRLGVLDDQSLLKLHSLMRAKPQGLRVRFGHPILRDGIGWFVGRAKRPQLDGPALRVDLHIDSTASDTPNGNLGDYVLSLAESDPAALAMSFILERKIEYQIDQQGKPLRDAAGNELPPIWRPTAVHALDLVDEGAATDSLLGVYINNWALALRIRRQRTREREMSL